jgi:hypothetical protein
MTQRLLVGGAILLLSACTTVTSLSSTHEGTLVSVRDANLTAPTSHPIKSTTFSNFEFKAVDPDAGKPFYGVLPLEFRGGHLALDILFFAPAAFMNLRTAYPYYQFDAVNQVVRYKEEASDPWMEYRPTAAEIARAEAYYKAMDTAPGAAPAAKP